MILIQMDDMYKQQFAFVNDELHLFWNMDGKTGADGNCFYISIVQQLNRKEVRDFLLQNGLSEEFFSWSPTELREKLCDWLIYHLTLLGSDGRPLRRIGRYLMESEEKDIQTDIYWKNRNVLTIRRFLEIQSEGCKKHQDMAWANHIIVRGMAYF
jgi:hypothetical protein